MPRDAYDSDDSEASRSFFRGSFEGTNDLPEADQRRINSKLQAKQNWIRAMRNIEKVAREEHDEDEESQRQKVKEILKVEESQTVDESETLDYENRGLMTDEVNRSF